MLELQRIFAFAFRCALTARTESMPRLARAIERMERLLGVCMVVGGDMQRRGEPLREPP
jgi:hypothetical protein